ncbi:MAG: glycosyltransferase family 4 protein, partial [Candidatus Heimdallarchaeota archaeon]|nr:glycosyltransferase family 4 protein [Candidatus Heimdallarchaeota archaeon]
PVIWGGLGTFAIEMTLQQRAFGHNVSVYAFNEKNNLKIEETWQGITVYRPKTLDLQNSLLLCANDDLHNWGNHFSFFSDVFGYNMMSAHMLTARCNGGIPKKYDIIDAHDWLGVIGGMMVKQSTKLPLVFHVHSTEPGRSLGGGSPTIIQIEKQGAETADAIITVSYAMKEELKQLGFPQDKIHVCWNGIDTSKYDPAKFSSEEIQQLRGKYGIKSDEIFLFFIGRLVTVKGIDQLVNAMPDVIEQYPKVKLVILGVGDLEESIRQKINEFNLTDHVIIRNEFVSEQERILHYAASDLVVLPSLYEPFGIVCTEAMSMAKPVVVGAHGINGMREQIVSSGPDQSGIHINPHHPSDIAWGIKQLMQQIEQWDHIGSNGRKRAIELFSWETIAQRTIDIYRTLF